MRDRKTSLHCHAFSHVKIRLAVPFCRYGAARIKDSSARRVRIHMRRHTSSIIFRVKIPPGVSILRTCRETVAVVETCRAPKARGARYFYHAKSSQPRTPLTRAYPAANTKAGLQDPAFAACTYRASFPQPVGGPIVCQSRQLCASSRQSPPGRKHHEARRIEKIFCRVINSPSRSRLTW